MRFTIPGMSCGGCLKAITRVVLAEDPAATVEGDLAAKEVRISSAAAEETLRLRLAEAGYPPIGAVTR